MVDRSKIKGKLDQYTKHRITYDAVLKLYPDAKLRYHDSVKDLVKHKYNWLDFSRTVGDITIVFTVRNGDVNDISINNITTSIESATTEFLHSIIKNPEHFILDRINKNLEVKDG